jgi:hypothetical protein
MRDSRRHYFWITVLLLFAVADLLAQSADTSLFAVPTVDAAQCTNTARVSRPGSFEVYSLHRYRIGRSQSQLPGSAAELAMAGLPRRITQVVFDHDGRPLTLIDSVFLGWTRQVGRAMFDSTSRLPSFRESSTIDSSTAMAIALRLGPGRVKEAVDSVEQYRKTGERVPLESEQKNRAQRLAQFLWPLPCP